MVSFAVFGLLILAGFGVQWAVLNQEATMNSGSYLFDETFTMYSFMYGPQTWVPYASKMPISPGNSVEGGSEFYFMFVDLNATSNLNATFPCVKVDYIFTGLHGTAAFHVYGYISDNDGIS